ncbi:MAG: diguanylate cyclase [Rugosibacter sp.]|jgi:diguanylate cyclase|nr:diguanylate cyclase [Rugosibacter sp.]
MKYNHTKVESAEYLRLALPHMSKHDAPLNPISYAVWYEYVSGMNHALKVAIDTLLVRNMPLTTDDIQSLFNRHIADIDSDTVAAISEQFQRILGGISTSTGEAAKEADQFGKTLLDIEKNSALPGATIDLKTLIKSTQAMHAATVALQTKLTESQSEIAALREEVSRARDASMMDALTGLNNRRSFDQSLAKCLAEIKNEKNDPDKLPCLLMCDIDHFKLVNDSYGHLFGDRVIRAVANVLTANVKGQDTAARYGGEEFVVLLPDTPLEGAHILAEKIRRTIELGRIKKGGNEDATTKVTISLGVARYMPDETVSSFIERTDKALYKAKRAGRNQVCLAT